MHPNQIYAFLKGVLAEKTNRHKKEIRAEMVLRSRPPKGLGFTDAGLMALAQALNNAFQQAGHPLKPRLTPKETRSPQTVKDLFVLVASRL